MSLEAIDVPVDDEFTDGFIERLRKLAAWYGISVTEVSEVVRPPDRRVSRFMITFELDPAQRVAGGLRR